MSIPQQKPGAEQDYMGMSEIAMYAGTSKSNILRRTITDTFPKPVATLMQGRVWLTAEIITFFAENPVRRFNPK